MCFSLFYPALVILMFLDLWFVVIKLRNLFPHYLFKYFLWFTTYFWASNETMLDHLLLSHLLIALSLFLLFFLCFSFDNFYWSLYSFILSCIHSADQPNKIIFIFFLKYFHFPLKSLQLSAKNFPLGLLNKLIIVTVSVW